MTDPGEEHSARRTHPPEAVVRISSVPLAARAEGSLIAVVSVGVVFGRGGAADRHLAGLAGVPACLQLNADVAAERFPTILRAFALNVAIFMVAEVFILVDSRSGWRSCAACLDPLSPPSVSWPSSTRTSSGAFRASSWSYILGFGMPSLDIDWIPNSPVLLGRHGARTGLHGVREPRSIAPGSNQSIPARRQQLGPSVYHASRRCASSFCRKPSGESSRPS